MENLREKFKNLNTDPLESDPLDGHTHRFETKLMKFNYDQKIKKNNNRMWLTLLVAASFVGFVIFITLRQSKIDQQEYAESSTSNSPRNIGAYSYEAGLKQDYFEKKIKEKGQMKLPDDDPDLQAMVVALNKLENEYDVLNTKLNENFHNEHLINAILENYKLRLKLLEKIQKFVHFKNRIKTQNHEEDVS